MAYDISLGSVSNSSLYATSTRQDNTHTHICPPHTQRILLEKIIKGDVQANSFPSTNI